MQRPITPKECTLLLRIQQRIFEAADVMELCFLVANETWHLVPYEQACVFLDNGWKSLRLTTVSGLADGFDDTPFSLWASRVSKAFHKKCQMKARMLTVEDLPEELQADWAEWWPRHALFLPLTAPDGQTAGVVLYLREEAWTGDEVGLLRLLHRSYAYSLHALRPLRRSLFRRVWQRTLARPWALPMLAACCLGLFALPVHLSVLAPAEIVARHCEVISAPLDGVVKTFHIRPNQAVAKGALLFSLDDTVLRNRRAIALQALGVARTDLLSAERKSFANNQSRNELAALQGHVREKEAELAYLDESLSRVNIPAPRDGVLIYNDPNDWIGKPVVTGERIALLAQPAPLDVEVWVAMADAITMEPGAKMRVFLQTDPLHPLDATLVETSYQVVVSPDNVAAYRVRGNFPNEVHAHIGLRGVAKIYGDTYSLGYWIFRRPLGYIRQKLGL